MLLDRAFPQREGVGGGGGQCGWDGAKLSEDAKVVH